MKGLDTNVLVRYLVQDDPAQSKQAGEIIEGATASGEKLFLCSIVLCELVWVLESAYGVAKDELLDALEKILMATQFAIENRACAWAAWTDFRASKADFSDCLVGRLNRASGCSETFSFDRATGILETFVVLGRSHSPPPKVGA